VNMRNIYTYGEKECYNIYKILSGRKEIC
jgi:hypothetical protein